MDDSLRFKSESGDVIEETETASEDIKVQDMILEALGVR